MSITEMNNGDGVENGSGYSCLSMADEQEKQFRGGDRRIGEGGGEKGMKEEREDYGDFLGSSSCSSIGKNSDDEDGDNEEEEVQSSYKCEIGSFDSIQALEEALPMRRGMSRFYNGKSKSFTSLTDASSSSSINKIAKPGNAYSRRRRNLLAFNLLSGKKRSFQLKSNGGVSKRSTNTSRSTLALAVAMSSSPRSHEVEDNSDSSPHLISTLSPHHPQFRQSHCNGLSSSPRGNFSAWRSFSFADLQHCTSVKAPAPR